MKKTSLKNVQPLNRTELKSINGGAGVNCPTERCCEFRPNGTCLRCRPIGGECP